MFSEGREGGVHEIMLLIHAKKLSFSFYGYGFLWTCGFLFFFLSQSDSSAEFVAVKDFLYLGSILCTSLVVIAWYGKPAKGFPRIKAAKIGSVLLCMGALLASAANLLGDEATVVEAASRVLAGAGQSLSWVAWAEVLSRREVEEVEYAFLSWLPMLIVTFLAVVVLKLVFVVSPALLYCLIALLPVGSFLCFRALASEVSDSAALADRSESKGERIGKLGSRGSGFGASGSAGFDEGWTKRQCSQVMRMFISLGCIFVIISFVWNAFLSQGFQEFELLIVAFLGAAFRL